jgi:tellurite resistance protein
MTDTPTSRLANFPVAWFAMIMGLGGLTIAWRKAEELLTLPVTVSPWLLILATTLFAVLAALYTVKIIRHRPAAAKEWGHPVKMNFVPTVSIALILLSITWLPVSAPYSKLLWLAGTVLHLLLTLYVITSGCTRPSSRSSISIPPGSSPWWATSWCPSPTFPA